MQNSTFFKNLLVTILFLFLLACSQAQNVGIGTTTPNAKAALDIKSSDKGLLIPRTSSSSRIGIVAPPKGLMVYDTTFNGFYYYDGGRWLNIADKNYDSATIDYSSAAVTAFNLSATNGTNSSIPTSQNSGFIYDNGGPAGNYLPNSNSSVLIDPDDSAFFIRVAIEEMNIESSNDSLLFINGNLATGGDTIKISGTQLGNYTFNRYVKIVFISNGTNQFSGFKLRWGRVKANASLTVNAPPYGWHFDPKKIATMGGLQGFNNWHTDSVGYGSFSYGFGNKSIGQYSTAMGVNSKAIGYNSTAIGFNTKATGYYSTAIGLETFASGGGAIAFGSYTDASGIGATALGVSTNATGEESTAIGSRTRASGQYSTGMGAGTIASGFSSTAMGFNTTASGHYSTAMGNNTIADGANSMATGANTTASGDYSTAMGNSTTAYGANSIATGANTKALGNFSTAMGSYATANSEGSFVIADHSTSTQFVYVGANRMFMRFANGYRLYTSADNSTGASMNAGGNSWATISDYRKKENYLPAGSKSFLTKIANMQLGSWNYIGQDKNTYRHYGPMAQEFYKNFGNDGIGTIGNDTTIASADIDGVMMIAIQALIKENVVLKSSNEALKNTNEKVEARLQKLEAIFHNQNSKIVAKGKEE